MPSLPVVVRLLRIVPLHLLQSAAFPTDNIRLGSSTLSVTAVVLFDVDDAMPFDDGMRFGPNIATAYPAP